ncbi:MAG TPA: tRNA (adenosine(37)-N6)-dimethylallyltransferase MiaA [Pyrinomonadaceae bacterium]|nr:tRNA (adenosine(37)-N6)-dimethylallyltransferase MiaA [Pyrinomonadaceae bacterium]
MYLTRNQLLAGLLLLILIWLVILFRMFAIVGPTASGKSTLGINVAVKINGEIINCDSVQVYKEIEIATAKVPLEERKGVPHHLIDFVSPEINYTAGEWAREAAKKIEEIESRGRIPLLVGGTGFYLRALRQPFFVSPPTDESLRARLNQVRERRGPEHLHKLLRRIDPNAAGQLYPRDWPRVQRAIEVFLQTGRSIVDQQPERAEPHESSQRLRILALNPPRAELYKRINERTEAHFRAGLVDEVRQLLDRGFSPASNALGAHGYRRVVEYLKGLRDLESAVEQTKLDVRHYAKRQLTWFRHEADVEWFDGFGEENRVLRSVMKAISDGPRSK